MSIPPALTEWQANPHAALFPYEAVLAAYHRGGKHAVDKDLLDVLAAIRAKLPSITEDASATLRLDAFLDTALDRHDYRTYLALDLLPLPDADDEELTAADALRQRDRLTVLLITDLLGFEHDAAVSATRLLPRQRPDARTVKTRFRHGLRVIRPALQRLYLADLITDTDPAIAVSQARFAVSSDMTDMERLALRLSMLPVDVVHDEYLFLRVLQAHETTFALLAADLRAVISSLKRGNPYTAADRLTAATSDVREAAPLFSLVATIRPESFHAFRVHTDGASAIQSRHYEMVEALRRRPDLERLNSHAYRWTPDILDRAMSGQPTIEPAVAASVADGSNGPSVEARLRQAMHDLAEALTDWRHTHYHIALRMLGNHQPGTGATEGAAYLYTTRRTPVFNTAGDNPPRYDPPTAPNNRN